MGNERSGESPRYTVDYSGLLERLDRFHEALSRKRVLRFMLVLLTGCGAYTGYRLSCLSLLKPYKLVGLVGAILSFLGIVVLSELLASPIWKSICVKLIAPLVMWVSITLPIGMAIGCIAGGILHKPSSRTVFEFAVCFFAYVGVASAPFGELVVSPRFVPMGLEHRWKWMGFLLLLGGAACQIAAALFDITS